MRNDVNSLVHGILPIWKPPGCTSHQVVQRVRRATGQKRVGHTGTLDPAATGVLPICLGQATRVAEYVQNLSKTYEGTLTLGIATNTGDREGTIIQQKETSGVGVNELEGALTDIIPRFTGEITQVPPMYSAIKVHGRRLYELAREGKEIERKARQVHIDYLRILHIRNGPFPEIDFRVKCSKGTYIRTLCVDMGEALGYPAYMSRLVRVQSGPFTSEQCVRLEELEKAAPHEWQSEWLYPLDVALVQFPALPVSGEESSLIAHGRVLSLRSQFAPGALLRVMQNDYVLALYQVAEDGKSAKPVKVFARNR